MKLITYKNLNQEFLQDLNDAENNFGVDIDLYGDQIEAGTEINIDRLEEYDDYEDDDLLLKGEVNGGKRNKKKRKQTKKSKQKGGYPFWFDKVPKGMSRNKYVSLEKKKPKNMTMKQWIKIWKQYLKVKLLRVY